MRISREYGPQFDPVDGTIGKLQLVKRWVVLHADGTLFDKRQGHYTYCDRSEAETRAQLFMGANKNNPKVQNLTVGQWWCYPVHSDPAYPVTVNEVRRPVIGWISDSVDWVDSLIDCMPDVPAIHVKWGDMQAFLLEQRACNAIVIDVGEVGSEQVMKHVAENTNVMILVSGYSASLSQSIVSALEDCFPDHQIYYAGMNPDLFIRARIDDIMSRN